MLIDLKFVFIVAELFMVNSYCLLFFLVKLLLALERVEFCHAGVLF